MWLYNLGTASGTSGSSNVTGTTGAFNYALIGSEIAFGADNASAADARRYLITGKTDPQSITVYPPLQADVVGGSKFIIFQTSQNAQMPEYLGGLVGQMLNEYGGVVTAAGDDRRITLDKIAADDYAEVRYRTGGSERFRHGTLGTDQFRLQSWLSGAWVDVLATVDGKPRIYGDLGNAWEPTYSFHGDPDTGLYSPGANQVALVAGSVHQLLATSTNLTLRPSGGTVIAAGLNAVPDLSNQGRKFDTADAPVQAVGFRATSAYGPYTAAWYAALAFDPVDGRWEHVIGGTLPARGSFFGFSMVEGYWTWQHTTSTGLNGAPATLVDYMRLHLSGSLELFGAVPATNKTSGTIVVAGGVGVGGDIYASAVYDDGVLLTDYVFDALAGDERVYSPHVARRAAALDRRMFEPDAYADYMLRNRRLWGMPDLNDVENGRVVGKSLGDMIQLLWQTAELQAIHSHKINKRLSSLEGRVLT
ncbi:MAG TPA: hypothetical protein VNQ99_13280 [Xanthobacteraceae bacterium]|nr:hypothetical protein [Xanthobacteraceae bacterium]